MSRERRLFRRVEFVQRIEELCFRLSRSRVTHLPEASHKNRILSSVVCDISSNMYATMEDVGGLSKNLSDRLPLGVVPVAHERSNRREEPRKK